MDKPVYSDFLESLSKESLDISDDDTVSERVTTFGELPKVEDTTHIDRQIENSDNVTQSAEAYRQHGKIMVTRAELEEALAQSSSNTFIFEERKEEVKPYPSIYYEHEDNRISSSTLVANSFKSIVNEIVSEVIEEHGLEYLNPKNGFVRLPNAKVVKTFIKQHSLSLIEFESAYYVDVNHRKVNYQDEKGKHVITPETIAYDAYDFYMKTDYSALYLVDKGLINQRTESVVPKGEAHATLKTYVELKGSEYGSFKPLYFTDLSELLKVPYDVSIPKFVLNEPFEDNNVNVPMTVINGRVVDDSKVGIPVRITLEQILKHVSDGVHVHFLNPKDIMPLLADVEHSLNKLEAQEHLRKLVPEMFYLQDEANEFVEDMLEKYILPYLVAIGKTDDVDKIANQIAPTQQNPFLTKMEAQFEESKDLLHDIAQDKPTVTDVDEINLDYTDESYHTTETQYGTVNEMTPSMIAETSFHTKHRGRDMSLTYNLLSI